MTRKVRIHEYHPSNPKIDVFFNGKYRYSTNWFSRCCDARTNFYQTATVAERLAPSNYLIVRKASR
jgi:hypothetical protein